MEIHSKLLEDSHFIVDLPLSQLRIIPDGDNPWFLLIPMRPDKKEWSDLSLDDQYQLTQEINQVCLLLKEYKDPDKLNVASLGNMVPQLHIHVIARYKDDRAWPGPIWGTSAGSEFDNSQVHFWQEKFKEL